MKRVTAVVTVASCLIAPGASAEFKEIRQTIFGMD